MNFNLFESILIFLIFILNLQKFTSCLWNSHFFNLNKKFFSFKIFKICRICSWCSFKVFENINISFKYVTTIMSRYSRSVSLIMFWHVIDVFINSNDITRYSYDLYFVRKIVFHFFLFLFVSSYKLLLSLILWIIWFFSIYFAILLCWVMMCDSWS